MKPKAERARAIIQALRPIDPTIRKISVLGRGTYKLGCDFCGFNKPKNNLLVGATEHEMYYLAVKYPGYSVTNKFLCVDYWACAFRLAVRSS